MYTYIWTYLVKLILLFHIFDLSHLRCRSCWRFSCSKFVAAQWFGLFPDLSHEATSHSPSSRSASRINFQKFNRIAPGLYKAVSHPYSFVKTHTFSNLTIAMVLSLLPVTFRIILVAASCGEVIAACSYEAVAKLRSDVATWSWRGSKTPTGEVWKKKHDTKSRRGCSVWLFFMRSFHLTFCHCQWCFSEPPNRGQKLLGHEKIGRSMVWTDPWSSYPHRSRKDQGQMDGFWVMGWWSMRLDYRNLYLKHPIVYKTYATICCDVFVRSIQKRDFEHLEW